MKKTLFSLLVAGVMGISALWAKPVSQPNARQVAQQFLQQVIPDDDAQASARRRVVGVQATDTAAYYVFETEAGGFVIVSADDCARPILAYGDRSFVGKEAQMPVQVKEWLRGYERSIRRAVADGLEADEQTRAAWRALAAASTGETKAVVAPLIATHWNQNDYSANEPTYNKYTPTYTETYGGETYTEHTPVGCVATAMAQVMNYWEWPDKGVGSNSYTVKGHSEYGTQSANFGATTYDWANMPDELVYGRSTAAQIDAVALLSYHCGVAIDMMYDPEGSGAYTGDLGDQYRTAYRALRDNFRYKNTLESVDRDAFFVASDWDAMLKEELQAGRPVIYSGNGGDNQAGHCFVCCGYDTDDRFYFNFGWGGNADGYYSLDAIRPGSGGAGDGGRNYSFEQDAIIGIVPDRGDYVQQNHFKLRLPTTESSKPTLSNDTIAYNHDTFSLQFRVVLFNSKSSFADSIAVQFINEQGKAVAQSKGKYVTCNPNYSQSLTFSISPMPELAPGNYRLQPVYRTNKGNWVPIASRHWDSALRLVVVYASQFNTYSSLSGTPMPWINGEQVSCTIDIANYSSTDTYYGKFYAVLMSAKQNQIVQFIDSISCEANPLNPYYYNTFNFSGIVKVPAGDYRLAFVFQTSMGMNMVGSIRYPSIFPVSVLAKGAQRSVPKLSCSSFSVTNTAGGTNIKRLEDIVLRARVTNTGAEEYTRGVRFTILDETATQVLHTYTRPATVLAGQSLDITYVVDTALSQGTYNARMSVYDTETDDWTVLNTTKQFYVRASDYSLRLDAIDVVGVDAYNPLKAGEAFEVRFTVTNVGDTEYSGQRIYAYIYTPGHETGKASKGQYVNIAAQETKHLTFSFEGTLDAGDYEIYPYYSTAESNYLSSLGGYIPLTIVDGNVEEQFLLNMDAIEVVGVDANHPLKAGQAFDVKLTVTNQGGASYSSEVIAAFIYNPKTGVWLANKQKVVTIAAKETKQITYSFTDNLAAGEYRVYGYYTIPDDEEWQAFSTGVKYLPLTVVEDDTPQPEPKDTLRVTNIQVLDANGNNTIYNNQPFKVQFTVVNEGEQAYSDSLRVLILSPSNGNLDTLAVSKAKVTLQSKQSKQLTFSFTTQLVGGYYYAVVDYKSTEWHILEYTTFNVEHNSGGDTPASLKITEFELYSSDTYSMLLYDNEKATSFLSVKNTGTTTYSGSLRGLIIDYYTEDTVSIATRTVELAAGATNGWFFSFPDKLPGSIYFIVFEYSDNGWHDLGWDIFQVHNLRPYAIQATDLQQDTLIYEDSPYMVQTIVANLAQTAFSDSLRILIVDNANDTVAISNRKVTIPAQDYKIFTFTFTEGLPQGDYYVILDYQVDGYWCLNGVVAMKVLPKQGTALKEMRETLRIYPNPATDYVNVPVRSGTCVILYDAAGKQVLTETATADGTLTLHVSGLPTGIYMLHTQDADGKHIAQPLIKQ